MQNSYTFTFDASKPLPYGLWLDIPFRTKGATALRSEAKGRGARYLPNGKKWSWWLPQRRITQDSVNWFNKHNMFRGERKSPVFNSAIKWSDLNHTHPYNVVLRLPYEQKDIAKADGAMWDSVGKCWWFSSSSKFNESLFDKYAKMQAIDRMSAKGIAGDIHFFTEDDGSTATAAPVVAVPAAVPADEEERGGATYMLRNGSMVVRFVYNENGDNTVMITRYENGEKQYDITGIIHNFLNVQDARALWDNLIASGYEPCDTGGYKPCDTGGYKPCDTIN
jgi:hypothetical protein